MTQRTDLLGSIAQTIGTYRQHEHRPPITPTPAHVEQWINQFTPANQLGLLREFDHILRNSFITKETMMGFLTTQLHNEDLVGSNPAAYWKSANFLDIQIDGQSQKEMLELFDECLKNSFGFSVKSCGSPEGDYIYLDDVIFSGGRVGTDLQAWIDNKAPAKARVIVLVMVTHSLGEYQLKGKIDGAIKASGKKIKVEYMRAMELENRLRYRDTSEVLWPCSLPNDPRVHHYVSAEKKFPFQPRTPTQQTHGPFSSQEGRKLVEHELLIAGVHIRSKGNVSAVNRPLGHGFFGVGFGSMLTTYRNCPNNCPLAMWWGDPHEKVGALAWYPLLPRKNYSSAENVFSKFL
jgi:hypothetical protein